MEKPIYKRNWFVITAAIVVFIILGFIIGGGEDQAEEDVNQPVASEPVEEEEATEENSTEVDTSWDDVKDMDKIVGKGDKDFLEVTKSKPSNVRNDATGKWRKITISENVDIEEYILSYQDLYMEDEEVHFIINFNYNTTTTINNLGGLLYVDIKEYVDKEEHDANILGSGMLLKSYIIYPDGDIQETE